MSVTKDQRLFCATLSTRYKNRIEVDHKIRTQIPMFVLIMCGGLCCCCFFLALCEFNLSLFFWSMNIDEGERDCQKCCGFFVDSKCAQSQSNQQFLKVLLRWKLREICVFLMKCKQVSENNGCCIKKRY